jgi:hypothetical protein
MVIWVFIVFLLGLMALVFHLFNIFQWFTPWWGVVLMMISFGMLTRIWQKEREGEKEKLRERIEELEALLKF